MILLILFAFIAGIVTILSPCILPILPIVLSSSFGNSQKDKIRPLGVVLGFVASFTFFTLFLTTIIRLIDIPADTLRLVSVFIVGGFGAVLLIPKFQVILEQLFSKLTGLAPRTETKSGLVGGVIVGLSLGLLWTPCVGPILASVISLAITGTVTLNAFFITLAYSIGTAIPMFGIMLGGRNLLQKVPWLTTNTSKIQKAFGVLMIATAVAIFFNADRKFQTIVLNVFPKYGAGLTKLEDNKFIQDQLRKLNNKIDKDKIGRPMNELMPDKYPKAPEIITGGAWFNSQPLTLSALKGKVVVIDFWTYSCINCQRTLPYLRNWWEKYKDKGLVIIGIHSPEFEFEKEEKNVAQAILDFNLKYPIVQDNNFATWKAYNNRYWPAKYFIDKDGYIRYTHFGEGAYDESERVIQELLKELENRDITESIENPKYQVYANTPETYLGYGRIRNFVSPERIFKDGMQIYSKPKNLANDALAYEGEWMLTENYSNPQAGSKLYLNFEAKEVYLVMNPKEKTSKVKVYVDDKLQYFGEDNKEGVVTVEGDRLYKLIKLPAPGRHILKLEFEDNNTEVYAFTFG
ncbi:hypothetical protein A2716_04015 [candidate division WWE3 bacterium RIFCSPHIGHO2_01_FULL_40_23]|uniref:Thioredoxin domain-containing protein n=1 Tax=candidate division WWE3 bacterium RIFCSPLOWO2_01_FULL_41_18 TaxID=1802625 RepID=A0A1F4VCR5_UNCKA|nr:MAG: hypothetical protein A2716_04015 [candidate division WWE3 bacterium RIFCSPHIGHO2_01_FULL_40_23]OGC55042.1 MAG: hypothetical protein A3A78_03625 [candidate division WWE3 bacterium RIFCSPLOWO2_01_FULL_41_18]